MARFNDTQQILQQLKPIINQCIDNHPSVKSAIKAKKAVVENVNVNKKTVTVRFPFDTTLTTLPYNPQMENYLTTGTVKGKVISVWYYQSITNGIVMQDGAWGISEGNSLIDIIYPIGSIYMSVNNVNPQTLFGGGWQKIEGRFLLGSSSSYALGNEGGEATHLLTVNEMPKHNHSVKSVGGGIGTFTSMPPTADRKEPSYANDQDVGGGQPHNNMPPYLVVNIWKRTA